MLCGARFFKGCACQRGKARLRVCVRAWKACRNHVKGPRVRRASATSRTHLSVHEEGFGLHIVTHG
eukprot:710425-Prymnesium_polylepis.1